jgi:hypothetical protein
MKEGIYIDKKSKADLERKLRLISSIENDLAPQQLKAFVNNSEGDIVKDAPFDTGNLKQHVTGEMTGKLKGFVSSIALDKNNFDYAMVQEFGAVYKTYKRDGKPYFYPNIRKNQKALISGLKAGIKRILNK